MAEDTQIMPLAEKSLLLDGQVIGGRVVAVGERGHKLVSEDKGKTWQQQPAPTRATLTSVIFIDPANGWAAGHDSVILQTRDGGRHWQEVYADPDDERPILDLWFRDMNQGYAIGAYGLFMMTHDGGKSWQDADFKPATLILDDESNEPSWGGDDDEEIWVDFHLNQITVTGNGRLFIAAESGNIYRSDDGGRSWLSLPSPYEGSFYGALPLDQRQLLLYGLRGHLFHSADEGNNWTQVATGVQATLNDGIRLRDGRMILAGLAGTLLISDDSLNFHLQAQKDRAGIAKILQTDDGSLILLGENGARRLELPAVGKEAEK